MLLRVQPLQQGDPRRIGPYRVVGRLGSGGMGTVYAALSDAGARMAVKVVHPAQAADDQFRARFRREVQLSQRVTGSCLVPVVDADTDAEFPWLAAPYVPGPTLEAHVSAQGPLTGAHLYALAAGTAAALGAIHAAGVVHRDVKPANVILAPSGPQMVDFGIAHALDGTSVTRTGVLTGTPGWISPEHYRTGAVGPQGDIFAWGALVAYAATGRLPFGSGAADAVAFRVLSADPDLAGLPADLRDLAGQALSKQPSERPAAAHLAQVSGQLLAAQATAVVPVDGGGQPTLIADLITQHWDLAPDTDPAWPGPATATSRRLPRRVVTIVLATALLAGAGVGGVLALRPDGGHATASAAGTTPTAEDAAGREASPTAAGEARTAAGSSVSGSGEADPRTVPVPVDPLAGVARPAFTRADDEAQPAPGEWNASTAADGGTEADTAAAIRRTVTSMLATKDMDFIKPTVTFNRRAQTVIVTAGPISTLTDDYKEVFRRAGEMAACTTLARRLKGAPTSWPYGRYSVYWKDYDGQDEATILGFGQATTGCYPTAAGQREGTEEGMATAEIPSSDRDEIRIAGSTVKALTRAWNARVAEGHGLEPFDRADAITLGFDPMEQTMYVWAYDGSGALAGRAQQAHFQDVVTHTACPHLLAEYNTNTRWNYTHWAVAAYQGNSATPQIFAAGNCLPGTTTP